MHFKFGGTFTRIMTKHFREMIVIVKVITNSLGMFL